MEWIIIAIFLLLLGLLAAASVLLFRYACVRRPREHGVFTGSWAPYTAEILNAQEWLRAHTAEKIHLFTADSLKITGLFVPAAGTPKGTLIVMHGYRSLSDIDFAPQVEFLRDLGYQLIVPMQRSHDESEGKYITFGVKERLDCKLWACYAAERFGKALPIALCGISMGASTVLMASQLSLPGNVKAIIADCGFTSPAAIISHVARTQFHLPKFPILYTTNLIAKAVAKFGFWDASAAQAMRVNRRPVLFIHGGADHFVPKEMTMENYEACKAEKELLIVNGAGHAQSYFIDTAGYQKAVREFLLAHMQ